MIASGLSVGPQALGVAGATPDDTDGTATAYRSDIKEGASNSEIWDLADGRVNLSVKREYDGWTLEPSKEFLDREWFGTEPNDYAIFTINVVSL